MRNSGCLASIVSFIIVIAMFLFLIFACNSCTAEAWNAGVCPKCETRYDLKGVSQGLKYYACPDCGKEVQRYLTGG